VKIRFFCPRWGSEHLSWDEFAGRVADVGFDGVEFNFPLGDKPEVDAMTEALDRRGLELIAIHGDTVTPDFAAHKVEFEVRLNHIASARPLFINSHTGRDWFSISQNRELIAQAHRIAASTGIAVYHETHRSKFSFSAAATAEYLRADPELRIVADFSHWCNVSESLLTDQRESVSLAIERTAHIHARVGHPQGPQVSDPRAPEWAESMDAHLGWWDSIVALHRAHRTSALTVTPEFGPQPYMPTIPYTQQPVSSQWGINVYMMELLRSRWEGDF